MEKEIKIDSINISIGKRELSLSMDECKKLHEALSKLFGEKVIYRDNWWYQPYVPYKVTYGATSDPQSTNWITCSNNALILSVE